MLDLKSKTNKKYYYMVHICVCVFELFLSKLFVCRTEFAGGVWAGVELDTHQGKNDGAVKGRRNIISFHSKFHYC